MSNTVTTDEEVIAHRYKPIYNPIGAKPVLASQQVLPTRSDSPLSDSDLSKTRHANDDYLILRRPLFGPLLFNNTDSDARDHCANERTFLSWLRLSIYLSIVSVAIVISFHLKTQPTAAEKRVALPLGLVFWFLALACLASGFANYVKTVTKYSRKQALVQSGWKTQIMFTIVACSIVAACVLFLSTNVGGSRR